MGKKQVVGDCRLCGSHGPLEHSHVVSKAAYRRARLGPRGEAPQNQLVKVTRDDARPTSKQVKEYLLCGGCEDRFGKWETYAFPRLVQPDRSFPWLAGVARVEGPIADSSALDAGILALFGVSLLWRVTVSKHFDVLPMGANEVAVRRFLLGETPDPPDLLLLAMLLDPRGAARARPDRLFMTFKGSAHDGYTVHRFAILGVDFRLFLGPRLPRSYYPLCFLRTRRVVLRPADEFVEEIAEFAAGLNRQ